MRLRPLGSGSSERLKHWGVPPLVGPGGRPPPMFQHHPDPRSLRRPQTRSTGHPGRGWSRSPACARLWPSQLPRHPRGNSPETVGQEESVGVAWPAFVFVLVTVSVGQVRQQGLILSHLFPLVRRCGGTVRQVGHRHRGLRRARRQRRLAMRLLDQRRVPLGQQTSGPPPADRLAALS